MRTCRFCNEPCFDSGSIKYGVRHYAHAHCYFAAGRTLADLHPWQVGNIPWMVLKDHGLLEEAQAILRQHKLDKRADMLTE